MKTDIYLVEVNCDQSHAQWTKLVQTFARTLVQTQA